MTLTDHAAVKAARERTDAAFDARKAERAKVRRFGDVDPCVRCHTIAGWKHPLQHTPRRHNAEKYGLDGEACEDCNTILRHAARIEEVVGVVPEPAVVEPPQKLVLPCDLCGDASPENDRRVIGERVGLEGRICLPCCLGIVEERADSSRKNREAHEAEIRSAAAVERTRSLLRSLEVGSTLVIEPPDPLRSRFVATPCLARITRAAVNPTRADVRAIRRAWRKGDERTLHRIAFSWPIGGMRA
jgi:hypothetical protein